MFVPVTLSVHLELYETVKYWILTEPRASRYECKWTNVGHALKPFVQENAPLSFANIKRDEQIQDDAFPGRKVLEMKRNVYETIIDIHINILINTRKLLSQASPRKHV